MALSNLAGEVTSYVRDHPIPSVIAGAGGAALVGYAYLKSRHASSAVQTGSMAYPAVTGLSDLGTGTPAPGPAPSPIPGPGTGTTPPVKVGDSSGATHANGGKPGDHLDPLKTLGGRYRCGPGAFMTWEKGNTGNIVCQRKDSGVQFQVMPR